MREALGKIRIGQQCRCRLATPSHLRRRLRTECLKFLPMQARKVGKMTDRFAVCLPALPQAAVRLRPSGQAFAVKFPVHSAAQRRRALPQAGPVAHDPFLAE